MRFSPLRTASALALLPLAAHAAGGLAQQPRSPEQRAAAFLAAEVPRWRAQHNCYSCHNNGDAARALAQCVAEGVLTERAPLDDTLRFLAAPERWDANGPDGPFKDQKLARIQFAAALSGMHGAKLVDNRAAMAKAAALVAELQADDGSWSTDAAGTIGSPITYGQRLATAMATRALLATQDKRYDGAIERAIRWMIGHEPKSVLDAAATLLGLSPVGEVADARRKQCLELIARGQSDDGGWGPFVNSPSEVFDTALVVFALDSVTRSDFVERMARGRKYLLDTQQADGGWPATTRPPGVDSYAQRISTTAWATLALLVTRAK